MLQALDALSGITVYGYDKNDKLTQVTAPNGATTGYETDDLGNLLKETGPDRGALAYTPDEAGNTKSMTDARGITVNYAYDALNRVTGIDYPGTDEDIALTYDSYTGCANGIGRLCKATDQSGTTEYAYDAFGNVAESRKTELEVTYVTQYTYDAANRIARITYPDGRVATYTRDAIGRVTAISMAKDGTTISLASNVTYRADGLIKGLTYGNGLTEGRLYNLKGELTDQTLGSETRNYTYDLNGNLTQAVRANGTGLYGYDALDRLIQETSATVGQLGYTYDANGNRLSFVENGTTENYGYSPATNRLTQAGTEVVTLDAAGNTVADDNGARTFAYDGSGRLKQVKRHGRRLGTYVYDYRGLRTEKLKGGPDTVYHYDLDGRLIAESDAKGVFQKLYVWLHTQPLAQVEPGRAETLVYLHADSLGTPRLATDAGQRIVWRWEGQAFGDTLPDEDPDGDHKKTTVNLRYAGQYYDAETGLHYNWHRYYDPKIGRYLSSDPIGLEGGLNTYTYVENRPTVFADPLGLKTLQCTKPLDALTDKFGPGVSGFAHKYGPYTYHQYSCVVRNGKVVCGGQDHAGSPLNSPGKPSNDKAEAGQCKQTQPDNDCFEQCLISEWAKPRPRYGIPFGTDCQEYDDDVNTRCRKQCNIKK